MSVRVQARSKHTIVIAVAVALFVAFMLLLPFFSLIALSVIAAYVFFPVHKWLVGRTKREGLSAALTVLLSFLVVIIPIIFVCIATFGELQSAARSLNDYAASGQLGELGDQALEKTNDILGGITGGNVSLNLAEIQAFVTSNAARFADAVVGFITSSLGGIGAFFAAVILYMYIVSSLLTNRERLVRTFKGLNPLGDEASDMYLAQAGAMTKAMVRGQFIIAAFQGVVGAISLYIAGIELFWLFVLLLTVLSIIPLGGGIVTIPIGIVLLLTGNIWQGLVVLLVHFVIVTNIDNVLRPKLVPKEARLDSALTLLSVFSGIAMFGLLGIVIGPVLMILIVSTIKIYLENLPGASKQKRAKPASAA